MRILIDAMGGDNAPREIVRGGVDAAREFQVDVALVGRAEAIRACLQEYGAVGEPRVTVVDAPDVITMEDDPSSAVRRKKDSSMAVALRLLSEGAADACISAGSTGALLSGATLTVRRIRGIRRACFGPVLPNGGRGVLLIDCGANVECTSEYLLQFAYMGNFYARKIMGCHRPRIGLLNIGAEETKGTQLQKQTYELLSQAGREGRLNFIGNVEARDLLGGGVDVLVCDGFSGNVLLKAVEGTAGFLMKQLRGVFYKNLKNKLAASLMKEDIRGLRAMLDAGEVGGTALLGISKPVIKAHGSSDARAIRSAVKQAMVFIEAGVISSIEENIEYMRIANKEGE